jgi:HSP20 family protein
MAIIRWDPFREMREVMRRWPEDIFEDIEVRPYVEADVYETDEDVVVKMPVSGVKPDDIDISVTGDTVTIKGERKQEEEEKKKNYYYKEVRYGSFARSFTLPAAVQADKAEAKFKNGMLTLTIPKSEEAKPKVIKVKAEEEKK